MRPIRFPAALFFLLFLLCFCAGPLAAEELGYDFLIENAVIFDGKSTRSFQADLGIRGDKIAAIGDLSKKKARRVINAKGLVLAPGFIDAHTHSDFNAWIYPPLPGKVLQGVTTEIVGNCGFSAAPILGPHTEQFAGVWRREGVQVPDRVPWHSFAEYRVRLEEQGLVTNLAGLIGHGNVRSAVMGFSPRPATVSDIEAMKKILAQSMDEGAFGISFGLVYLPGLFAETGELTALCREAARHLGVCAFHMRSEGSALHEAIRETLQIAKNAQARLQISHLKASGKKNWEKIEEAFKLIEEGRDDGVDVLADAYPYTAGYAELGVTLPRSLYEREDRVALFQDLFKRQELLDTLRDYDEQTKIQWDKIMIASAGHRRYERFEGKTIKQIARETGLEAEKFLIDILADTSFETSAFYFSQDEKVVDQVLARPYVVLGSDSIADGTRKPHPRAYGTFPKFVREYVRKKKLLSLGEAIRKMTSLPADHFDISGRGTVKEGYFADLVLFDAGEITDTADYAHPKEAPRGIRWVFVNGYPVVENGKFNGFKQGRFLTRTD